MVWIVAGGRRATPVEFVGARAPLLRKAGEAICVAPTLLPTGINNLSDDIQPESR